MSATPSHDPRSSRNLLRAADPTKPSPVLRIGLAVFLLIEALLAFAPVAILGPAIGWPASLRNPAAQQLTAIAAAPGALTLGYGVYLLYSLAIAPVAIVVAWRVSGLKGPMAALIVTFGALSAFARAIGILRWLAVMPALAVTYGTADITTRATMETLFNALNSYGGGIGELLGVALFGGLWLLFAMIAALRSKRLPRWLAGFGLISAALQLVLFAPAIGFASPVPVAIAVSVFALWLMAFAAHVLRSSAA
jgi:Domain of unknown function (DUF4386)